MSAIAIRAAGVSKRYRIGSRPGYRTLREVMSDAAFSMVRHLVPGNGKSRRSGPRPVSAAGQQLWALRNISFDVHHGEVIGIIGRNGAGKSTLLKILSRITEPTAGFIEIEGRLGSLLEVGTGFHPELTGRENIYLNGAILGMRKKEIAHKFAEIMAFAEIEPFIDTPVKRYSSGMYTRLAFAVAAHLEPEILLVDEVLAVGDAAFQKKCLGKMSDVAQRGRTVFFVSHNLLAVQSLCSRVLWIDKGEVIADGSPGPIISQYLQTSFSPLTERRWPDRATAPGNADVRLARACVRRVNGSPSDVITVRTPFLIEIEYWNLRPKTYLNPSLQLYNEQGILVFHTAPPHEPVLYPPGLIRDVCHVPGDLLNAGIHRVGLHLAKDMGTFLHKEDEVVIFDVRDALDMRGGWHGRWDGVVRPVLDWTTQHLTADQAPRL